MPAMGGDMTVIDIPLAPTGLTERADWARRHTLTRYVPHKVERKVALWFLTDAGKAEVERHNAALAALRG